MPVPPVHKPPPEEPGESKPLCPPMFKIDAHAAFTKDTVSTPLIVKAAAFGYLVQGVEEKKKKPHERSDMDWNQILSMFIHNFIVACNELGRLPTGTEFRDHDAFAFVRLVLVRLLGTLKDAGYADPGADTHFALAFLNGKKTELMREIRKIGATPCDGLDIDNLDLLF